MEELLIHSHFTETQLLETVLSATAPALDSTYTVPLEPESPHDDTDTEKIMELSSPHLPESSVTNLVGRFAHLHIGVASSKSLSFLWY